MIKLDEVNKKNRYVGCRGLLLKSDQKAITLIALVITIVVLIILTGVAINLTLGENGILNRAKEAQQKQNEASAREKLEIVLSDARIEKETNTSYNSNNYLNDMLEEKGITVDGDYVIVDNYNFLIDREKLVIRDSLGETQIKVTVNVQEYLGKNANSKYEANLLLTVESNAGLQSIVITKPDGTTSEIGIEEAKTGKSMTVEFDDEYIVTVTTKDGKIITRKIGEKSEETIDSVSEFVAFRDAVNSGLTYEGKTISLTQDIDLSSVCGENINGEQVSWEPIGTETNPFKGMLNGNNKSILSINLSSNNNLVNGLFGINEGIIKNIVIENVKIDCYIQSDNWASTMSGVLVGNNLENGVIEGIKIKSGKIGSSTHYVRSGNLGAVCGKNYGTITKCINQINIYNDWPSTGGIVGNNLGRVELCVNMSDLNSNQAHLGGIVGCNEKIVENCYNIGNINITGFGAAGGIVGVQINNGTITNCYSVGTVTASSYLGNIVGENRTGVPVTNCPETNITATILGDAYTNDIQNKDGTWKYNDGYPILKWQIGE